MNGSRGLRFGVLTALALALLLSGGVMQLELQANGGPATLTAWGIPTPDSLPMGVAIDPTNGQVYFAEFVGDKIGRLDPGSNVITEWAAGDGPNYLALDISTGSASLYFTEGLGNRVSRLIPSVNGYSYATVPTDDSWPNGVALGFIGMTLVPSHIWFSERMGNKLARLTLGGLLFDVIIMSTPTERMVAPATQYLTPTARVVTPATTATWGSPPLPPPLMVDPGVTSGPFTEWPLALGPGHPAMIARGPNGDLWLSTETNSIIQFDPDTNAFIPHSLPSGSASLGLAIDSAGHIWFTESWQDKIGRLDPTTGMLSEWPLTSASQPFALALAPDGSIWFSEREGDRIGMLDPSTNTITEYQLASGAHPLDIAFDGAGSLWFTTERANYLGRLTVGPVLGPPPVGLPLVEVSVDRGCGSNYNPGDPIDVLFRVSEASTVKIRDFDQTGRIVTINIGSPIAGGTLYRLSSFTGPLTISGGAGVETVVIQATTASGVVVSSGCSFGIGGVSPSLVSVTVDRGCDGTYHLGETATVTLQSGVSGQVRLFNVSRDGQLVQIPVFPPLITPGLRITVSAPFTGAIGRNTLVMQVATGSQVLTSACSTNVLP
ncbi:MAG: hypothetical protein NUW06_02345 [Candidatus Acetothermia bacterium]|nr:hypothetical protein [Candidatus Acetothermia bacterium]MDH7504593.1 hypothetical protein [Candidatus Acetothermia bacterium]